MSVGYDSKAVDFRFVVANELFDQMLDGPVDDDLQQDIYRTTQEHDFESRIKRSVFKVALGETNEEVPIVVTFNEKLRHFLIQIDKMKMQVRGKKLTDPKLFPVMMVHNRRGWKVTISLPAIRDEKGK